LPPQVTVIGVIVGGRGRRDRPHVRPAIVEKPRAVEAALELHERVGGRRAGADANLDGQLPFEDVVSHAAAGPERERDRIRRAGRDRGGRSGAAGKARACWFICVCWCLGCLAGKWPVSSRPRPSIARPGRTRPAPCRRRSWRSRSAPGRLAGSRRPPAAFSPEFGCPRAGLRARCGPRPDDRQVKDSMSWDVTFFAAEQPPLTRFERRVLSVGGG
jgi:hypothetical protein